MLTETDQVAMASMFPALVPDVKESVPAAPALQLLGSQEIPSTEKRRRQRWNELVSYANAWVEHAKKTWDVPGEYELSMENIEQAYRLMAMLNPDLTTTQMLRCAKEVLNHRREYDKLDMRAAITQGDRVLEVLCQAHDRLVRLEDQLKIFKKVLDE